MQPVDIIKYITWYATENGIRLTTNRLVKFVYLADLYNARIKDGKTLTGFQWRFINFGPYCSEVMECIDEAVYNHQIEKTTFDSKFGDYHTFACHDKEMQPTESQFHVGVIGQIQKAIEKFGEDTPMLLDYVYFETEPMEHVRKGDMLNFSKAKPFKHRKKIELKKLSPDSIKKARESIKALSKEIETDKKNLIQDEIETRKYIDPIFDEFINFLEEDELEVGLNGTAKIQIANEY